MHMSKHALITCILCLIVMGAIPWQVRAQTLCEEEKEILGLSLTSPAGKRGNKLLGLFSTKGGDKPSGLLVSSVEPLGFEEKLALIRSIASSRVQEHLQAFQPSHEIALVHLWL